MLLDSLRNDLTVSLKDGQKTRLETLRFLLADIRNTAIAKYGNEGEAGLTDRDVLEVIKKQVKSHKESIAAYEQAERQDLVQKEQEQLEILLSYLPPQYSDEELRKILEPLVATGEKNFGLLMQQAKELVGDRAESGRIASILKQILQ